MELGLWNLVSSKNRSKQKTRHKDSGHSALQNPPSVPRLDSASRDASSGDGQGKGPGTSGFRVLPELQDASSLPPVAKEAGVGKVSSKGGAISKPKVRDPNAGKNKQSGPKGKVGPHKEPTRTSGAKPMSDHPKIVRGGFSFHKTPTPR